MNQSPSPSIAPYAVWCSYMMLLNNELTSIFFADKEVLVHKLLYELSSNLSVHQIRVCCAGLENHWQPFMSDEFYQWFLHTLLTIRLNAMTPPKLLGWKQCVGPATVIFCVSHRAGMNCIYLKKQLIIITTDYFRCNHWSGR